MRTNNPKVSVLTPIYNTNPSHSQDKSKNNKKISVAFCIPTMIIGGVETVFVNTIDELSKYPDLEITILTHLKIKEPLYTKWLKNHPEIPVYVYYPMGNFFEFLGRYTKVFPLKNIRTIVFGLYKRFHRFFMSKNKKLKEIDIFIDYKNFEFFKELSYFNQPKIIWLHSALSYFESCGFLSRLPLYKKSIGITDEFVEDFKVKQPKYKNNIIRIYNPINVEDIREKANLEKSPNGKYFCHVSRLVDGKDIKTLLDAFDLFAKSYQDVKLYVVGDGFKADKFKAYASTLKSCNRIIFVGTLDNPYPIMSGAMANILSSEYEGLPTVVLESVALNIPCISSNCKNGPREILLDGKAGLLFNIGDTNQLYKHMCDVYTDSIDKKSMIENMQKSIKRFEPAIIAQQIHDVICNNAKGL